MINGLDDFGCILKSRQMVGGVSMSIHGGGSKKIIGRRERIENLLTCFMFFAPLDNIRILTHIREFLDLVNIKEI